MRDQKGAIPLLLLVTVIGIISVLAITSLAPFRNQLLSSLFPKQFGFAATNEMGIIAGNTNLSATFNSIGIEFLFTGDINNNSKVEVEYKKANEQNWKKALDLWKTDDQPFRNLLSFWQFEETSGSSLADFKGNNTAIANGTTSTSGQTAQPGKVGLGRIFNGTSDYIQVTGSDSLNFSNKVFSYSAWAKTNSSTDQAIISKGGLNGAGVYLGLNAAGNVYASVSDGTKKIELTCTSQVANLPNFKNNLFHMYTLTLDRGTETLIKEGKPNGAKLRVSIDVYHFCEQSIDSLGSIDSTDNFRIGASGSSSNFFKGTIDQVFVFNNSLSLSTIQYLWRNDTGTIDLPTSAIFNTPGPAFYGSVLLLNSGTDYNIKLNVVDSDGGTQIIEETIHTRDDTIADASTLTPTHYVKVDGNDSNNGTSAASAWKTLQKAITNAPASAVVEIGPGIYTQPPATLYRTTPVTLKAQFPAIDNNQQIINQGKHTIIEPNIVTGPTNSDAPYKDVWQQITVGPGPIYGKNYTLWKWSHPAIITGRDMNSSFAANRTDPPLKLITWNLGAPVVANSSYDPFIPPSMPEDIAERMYENTGYNYGIAPNGTDIFLRLPPNAKKADGTPTSNPNDLFISISDPQAPALLNLNGPDIRVSGLEVRGGKYNIRTHKNSVNNIIDHNLLVGGMGIVLLGDKSPSRYGSNHVIEHNRIIDFNLWANSGNFNNSKDPNVPTWNFIKTNLRKPNPIQKMKINGTPLSGTFKLNYALSGTNEAGSTANLAFNATNQQVQTALEAITPIGAGNVKVSGGPLPQNEITIEFVGKFAKFGYVGDQKLMTSNNSFSPSTSITLTDISNWGNGGIGSSGNQTSGIHSIGGAKNTVIRHNHIDGTFNGVSAYHVGFDRYANFNYDIHDNYINHIGDDALEPETYGSNWRIWNNKIENSLVGFSTGPAAYGPFYLFKNTFWNLNKMIFKYTGTYLKASPKIFAVNNTFWTNATENSELNMTQVSGGDTYAGNSTGKYTTSDTFFFRNNLFRLTGYAFVVKGQAPWQKTWDEDYNHFATTDTLRGLQVAGQNYTTDVPAYRQVIAQGTHTNTSGDFVTPSVIDTNLNNVLTGNLALKSGSSFIDAGTIVANIADCYAGSSPDIGAHEFSLPTNCVEVVTPPPSTPPSTSQPSTPPKVGDIIVNGKVDLYDYNALLTDFGKKNDSVTKADLDDDNDVDLYDYNILLTNFGR